MQAFTVYNRLAPLAVSVVGSNHVFKRIKSEFPASPAFSTTTLCCWRQERSLHPTLLAPNTAI